MAPSLFKNGIKETINKGVPTLPKVAPGEVWWATCTVTDRVLRAALAYSVVRLTETMSTTLARVETLERRKQRPVIIVDIPPATGWYSRAPTTVTVLATATFGQSRVHELDLHTQHFAMSVGRTTPWPARDSYVLQPDPDWPRSAWKPCYTVAYRFDLPISCLTFRYTGELGGPQSTYTVSNASLLALRNACSSKLREYRSLPAEVLIEWNKSFEARESFLLQVQARAQTLPPAAAPARRAQTEAPAPRAAPTPRAVPTPRTNPAARAAPAPGRAPVPPRTPAPAPAPTRKPLATPATTSASTTPAVRLPADTEPRTTRAGSELPSPQPTRPNAIVPARAPGETGATRAGTDFRKQLSAGAAAFVPSPSLAQRVQAGIAYVTTLAVGVLETLEAANERPAEESDQAYVSNPDYNNHAHLTSATYVEQDLHQYPAPLLAQAPPPRRDTGHARTQSAPAFSFIPQTQSLPGAPMDVAPRYPAPPAQMYPAPPEQMYPAPPAQIYPAGYGQQQGFSPPPPGSPVQPAPQYYLPPPPPPQFNPIQQQRVVVGGTTYQNFQMPSNQQMYVDAFTHAQAQVQAAQVAAAQAAAAHAHAMQYNGYY